MIETVARAIYEEDDPWHKAWPWPNLNPEAQGGEGAVERYRAIARAAIEAMREPDEAMIDRFVSRALCVSVDSTNGGWSGYARDQWQTMLAAALT